MIKSVDYHIIDKCNLNCACCNDFCPLVPSDVENGKSLEQIKADLTLLSKLKNEFDILNLMGGEPTLHPNLSQVLRIAREILPDNHITMITNATKYNEFNRWKDSIIENNIKVIISAYPYCDDYMDRVNCIIETLGPDVETEVWAGSAEIGFNYGTISNKSGLVSEEEIIQCPRRYYCPQVKNGKLYICPFAAQFNRLKDYFGDEVKFELDGKEYLDLNGEVKPEDFYRFIFEAKPRICEHCVGAHNHWLGPKRPWGITERKLEEWVS